MRSPVKSITVSANGFGQFTAQVKFSHALSENDPRPEFNLGRHWPNVRRLARTRIVNAIAERDQRTIESRDRARIRVRKSLGPIDVTAQDLDSLNRLHGISFRESY